MGDFLRRHIFKLLFALLGLVLAILILTIGIWKTILIALMMLLGGIIGHRLDSGSSFKSMIARWANGGSSHDDFQ